MSKGKILSIDVVDKNIYYMFALGHNEIDRIEENQLDPQWILVYRKGLLYAEVNKKSISVINYCMGM